MAQHQRQDQRQQQRQHQKQAQVAIQAQRDIQIDDNERTLREDQRERAAMDRSEPQDWDESTSGAGDAEFWDQQPSGMCFAPRSSLRVEFAIQVDGSIVGRSGPSGNAAAGKLPISFGALRRAIVEGIALHLKLIGGVTQLSAIGDWADIPRPLAADGESVSPVPGQPKEWLGLIELIRRRYREEFGEHGDRVVNDTVHRITTTPGFLDFAIRLPNDDVVTPRTLVKRAMRGRAATRAGALRRMRDKPATLAGNPWSGDDWQTFINSQKDNARKRKKSEQKR